MQRLHKVTGGLRGSLEVLKNILSDINNAEAFFIRYLF